MTAILRTAGHAYMRSVARDRHGKFQVHDVPARNVQKHIARGCVFIRGDDPEASLVPSTDHLVNDAEGDAALFAHVLDQETEMRAVENALRGAVAQDRADALLRHLYG